MIKTGSIVVQKFGGTSVADAALMRACTKHVKAAIDRGDRVIVVVSAMGHSTDELIELASTTGASPDPRELDQLLSTGEQAAAALFAMVLASQGVASRSLTGWQAGMLTDNRFGRASISSIDPQPLALLLEQGITPVVTGFQGMTAEGQITTLGRGGSDTSAVALAAAFGADRCDIYTDVDGVYTCDPRIVSGVRKLERVSYEEMLELASQGAKVLQTRSVEIAMNHNVVLQVRSTFSDAPGTLLVREEDIMEQQRITGIAYSRDEARITLSGVKDKPGVSAAIFGPLAASNINVDMIVQNVAPDGKVTDVTFTVARGDLNNAVRALEAVKSQLEYQAIHADAKVAKLSVIGVGMRSHAGVASQMFATLAERNINIMAITTSEIKVSVLIEEAYIELALRALHTAYGLDAVVERG